MVQRAPAITYADYVAAEERSGTRHEFLRGEVFAMAGGTPEHGALTIALAAALASALRGRPCRIFSSDVRLRIPETGLATYPDLTVVCGRLETDPEDANAVINPVLLVEVLSDSSEAYDRGEKAAHYRKIASLKEYALISQREARIEVFRRNDAGRWELFEARPGETIELASVGCEIEVDEVYRNPLEQ